MKDNHLNIFWQYNTDETINITENNITRNSLLTFDKTDDDNKKLLLIISRIKNNYYNEEGDLTYV